MGIMQFIRGALREARRLIGQLLIRVYLSIPLKGIVIFIKRFMAWL